MVALSTEPKSSPPNDGNRRRRDTGRLVKELFSGSGRPGWVSLLFAALCLAARLNGLTLEELTSDPKLTPKKFAGHFSDFDYVYHKEVQPPDLFLQTKRGDCDDYAIVADLVLRPKGYDTRLIAVRMPGLVTHVVCYVSEEKGYLDYNNRIYLVKVQKCGPTLREIAAKVAHSFDANWTSASEFTYSKGLKRLVATVVKTDPPEHDPIPGKPPAEANVDSQKKLP